MVTAYIYCYLVGFDTQNIESIILIFSGFVIGYFMCMLTLNVVSSATSTIYVCFAENSSIFQVISFIFIKLLFLLNYYFI